MSTYWRSLKELAESPEVADRLAREFEGYDPERVRTEGSMSRRGMMKLMAASMALAGVTAAGCRRWPKEVIAPFAAPPKNRVPGVPEYYATGSEVAGVADPLIVASFDGRPIKVEGNPEHPMSAVTGGKWGSSTVTQQASVLDLYDPYRAYSGNVIDRRGVRPRRSSWPEFEQALADATLDGGRNVAFLTEHTSSPTALRLMDDVRARFPNATFAAYEPADRYESSKAVERLTGTPGRPVLALDKARVVVSFDDDFLGLHPAVQRQSTDWAVTRRSVDEDQTMSRVYLAECGMSRTGSVADVREPVHPARLPALINALAAAIDGREVEGLSADEALFVETAAADLREAGSAGLVTVNGQLPADVQAAALAINGKLGSVGTTLRYVAAPAAPGTGPIAALVERVRDGQVDALVILGGNPAYDAPAELEFAGLLTQVPFSAHLSPADDETSALCSFHLPRAHYLEAWGDGRSWDGHVTLTQPLILPLYNGRSMVEVLAMLAGNSAADGMVEVRKTTAALGAGADGDWQAALHRGFVPGTAYETLASNAAEVLAPELPMSAGDFALRFVPDDSIYDGRFANNGWLQEVPKPLTKLTWDNALIVGLETAEALGVDLKDYASDESPMASVTVDGVAMRLPILPMPGVPANVGTVALGFGRRRAGQIAGHEADGVETVGFDVYPLRTSAGMHLAAAEVAPAAGEYALETTQDHYLIDDIANYAIKKRVGKKGHAGKIVREATLAEYQRDRYAPHAHQHDGVALQIFEPPNEFNTPHAWGMTIDMAACTACNACVVACQSENNIPIVGKKGVHMNREMHWLRIDRYFKTDKEADKYATRPDVVNQPVACVHCENAPCEQVCPVAATVHDTEGLNTMVYNRCIGTRYCSNNCPYKVRRFNYFDWHAKNPRGDGVADLDATWLGWPDQQQTGAISATERMVFNPDVSVRMRGVMEKCTYCTQRIQAVTIDKRNRYSKGEADTELVSDMELKTACQQACPTEAIIFGDLNQAGQTVSKQQKLPRSYGVLSDLNTRPRTKHLAIIRNRPDAYAVEHKGDDHGGGYGGGDA